MTFAARDLVAKAKQRVADHRRHRADMAVWGEAQTLNDLGELGAQWLEGRLVSQPGYQPNTGPAEETTELTAVLAAVNRAGFFTHTSQPGVPPGLSWDNTMFVQHAVVEGYADDATLADLQKVVDGTELHITWAKAGLLRDRRNDVPGTYNPETGEEFTGFGCVLSWADIEFYLDGCSDSAIEEARNAWQVTIIDLIPGRNDLLWECLALFARNRGVNV